MKLRRLIGGVALLIVAAVALYLALPHTGYGPWWRCLLHPDDRVVTVTVPEVRGTFEIRGVSTFPTDDHIVIAYVDPLIGWSREILILLDFRQDTFPDEVSITMVMVACICGGFMISLTFSIISSPVSSCARAGERSAMINVIEQISLFMACLYRLFSIFIYRSTSG